MVSLNCSRVVHALNVRVCGLFVCAIRDYVNVRCSCSFVVRVCALCACSFVVRVRVCYRLLMLMLMDYHNNTFHANGKRQT